MVTKLDSAMIGAGNIILDGASTVSSVGSVLGLDTATITSIFTLAGIIAAMVYTYYKERNSSLSGYRSYEKDIQEQMSSDIKKLRAGSEKYAILRLKLLGMAGVDGEAIIKEVEKEYKELNE